MLFMLGRSLGSTPAGPKHTTDSMFVVEPAICIAKKGGHNWKDVVILVEGLIILVQALIILILLSKMM